MPSVKVQSLKSIVGPSSCSLPDVRSCEDGRPPSTPETRRASGGASVGERRSAFRKLFDRSRMAMGDAVGDSSATSDRIRGRVVNGQEEEEEEKQKKRFLDVPAESK